MTATTVAPLSAKHLKRVMADWRQLDAVELMDAVVEFFNEAPMRASANALVSWVKNANAKSFAVVNWAIEAGDKAVRDLARTRERGMTGRDTKGLKHGQKPKNMAIIPGINGPVPGGAGGGS